jgi:hypothetical protein
VKEQKRDMTIPVKLQEAGYSEKAIQEIIKYYRSKK